MLEYGIKILLFFVLLIILGWMGAKIGSFFEALAQFHGGSWYDNIPKGKGKKK